MSHQPRAFIEAAPSVALCLDRALLVFDSRPLFGTIADGKVSYQSALHVRARAAGIANGFASLLGLARRSTVAICLENCPEWMLTDFACTFNDYVVVGMQTVWPLDEIRGVLEDAEVDCVVCGVSMLDKFLAVGKCSVKHVVLAGAEPSTEQQQAAQLAGLTLTSLTTLERSAGSSPTTLTGAGMSHPPHGFQGDPSGVKVGSQQEIYTLIYSSGTTGRPKAVVVTKARWKTDQLSGIGQAVEPSVTVIHQALAHGCDRGICWQAALSGGQVVFTRRSHHELLEDMTIVRPTYLMAMSHFWSRLYSDCMREAATLAAPIVRGNLAGVEDVTEDALEAALDSGEGKSAIDALVHSKSHPAQVLERAYRKIRTITGGRLQVLITGGSFTSREVVEWMRSCFVRPDDDPDPFDAILVKNAYGATEFPGISVDGDISPAIDLQLADVPEMGYTNLDKPYPRGEIKVRNKSGEMSFYWKRPEENEKAFRNGWYHTGDIGCIDSDGKLHIIDRKHDLIELYVSGRSVWVAFAELEQLYLTAEAVDQLFLFGDRNEDRVLAGAVLDQAWLLTWLEEHELPPSSMATVLQDAAFRSAIETEVLDALQAIGTRANKQQYEIPAGVVVAVEPWTPESGLATPVGKLRHGALCKKFKPQFDEIYSRLAEEAEPGPGFERAMSSTSYVLSPLTSATSADLPPNAPPAHVLWQLRALTPLFSCKPEARAPHPAPPPAPESGDYMDFHFDPDHYASCPPHVVEELRAALKHAKSCCQYVRSNLIRWKHEQANSILSRRREVHTAAALATACVRQRVAALMAGGGSGLTFESKVVAEYLESCFSRQLMVRRCHARLRLESSAEHTALKRAQSRLHHAVKVRLRQAAAEAGLRVPYQILSNLWASPVFADCGDDGQQDAATTDEGALENSIGDVHVVCEWCGITLEGEGVGSGTPRFHCLDLPDVDRCTECHAQLLDLTARLSEAAVPAEHIKALVPAYGCAFALENTCAYFLQDMVKSADPAQDNPATFVARACQAYESRLALGFPDPVELPHAAGPAEQRFQTCPVVQAAGMSCTLHEKFRWLTYHQVGQLAARIASRLLSLPGVQKGSHIGICGYNTIEWAVADFACALAGCVAVGVHTTYNDDGAAHVINDSGMVCLCITADHFSTTLATNAAASYWRLDRIWDSCPNLKSCVLLDREADDLHDARVHSFLDFARDDARVPAQKLADPEQLYRPEDPYTIFYTSGTTGRPKGVLCPVKSFVTDIRSRVFVVPLVTASYIPLSHTSDRMKVWEFLGNGGRVGFCFYGASNWTDHETEKKSGLLRARADSDNNVLPLFRQLEALSPVGLACPPRIWAGLLSWYKAQVREGHDEETVNQWLRAKFGSRIKALFTGGAPTSVEIMRWVQGCLSGIDFHDSYGATECGAICEDGVPMIEKGVEVALLDIEDRGFSVDDRPNPRGEIIVRSPSMASGYHNQPQLTAAAFLPGGWFRTGDLGMLEAEGPPLQEIQVEVIDDPASSEPPVTRTVRAALVPQKRKLFVLERLSSVFSVQGQVVYPSKLETVLESVDGIDQAYVQGDSRNEAIICLVVLDPDANDLDQQEVLRRLEKLGGEMSIRAEQVPRSVRIAPEPFSELNGQLSSQLKKVRSRIASTYKVLIKEMDNEVRDAQPPPAARCCDTHRFVYSGAAQEQDIQFQRLQAASQGPCWAVLVAGETWSAMKADKQGTRPGKYLGSHCSLENIGSAYAQLVDTIGRDHIIVIAQLRETLEWLEAATKSEQDCAAITGNASLLPVLRRKLCETQEACARLIADGGSDYDFQAVNPDTVVRVLTGESGPGFEKVVPQHGCGSLLLVLNSHGNCHRVTRDESSPLFGKREWYLHLPYPSPDDRRGLYQFVSYAAYAQEKDHPDPAHLLYGRLLFYAFHTMLERAPFRKIVGVYQFCLSGGHSDFLELPAYHQHFNTHRWPVFLMLTSGKLQSSLGDFLPLWVKALHDSLAEGADATLQQLFASVCEKYWRANREVRRMNEQIRANPSADDDVEEMTFGEVAAHHGVESNVAATSIRELFDNSSYHRGP